MHLLTDVENNKKCMNYTGDSLDSKWKRSWLTAEFAMVFKG